MSTEQQKPAVGYGYASDEVKVSPFNFGGNFGKTFLTKFEWIANGGKDGAEQEALDVVFNINGTDKSYRMFPITKVFGKNNEEITDPNSQEFQDAIVDFNARITHILHAFLDSETIKAGFARPINSFKDFCQVAMSLLPKDFKERPLDIFLQFQWQLRGEQEKTYLEIPTKMKYGKWLCAAQPGEFKAVKADKPSDDNRKALYYVNAEGVEHPFVKNGWFMNSNFANQLRAEGAEQNAAAAAAIQADGAAKTSSW
jgi:hypothetical protein